VSEVKVFDLVQRREVEPPDEPDERGWVVASAQEAVYRTTTLTADVDEVPLGVTSELGTVRTVRRVPPDSIRLQRLAFEREQGITDDKEEQ
jgi:hypothetical protein